MSPPASTNFVTPVLDLFSLRGKIAVVTGAGRGIGPEVARAYAEAGADVAIIYHTTATVRQRAEEIQKANGVRVRAFQSDVRSRSRIAETLREIAIDFGQRRIDVVVANSGVCANVPSLDCTEQQWQSNSSVNYDGVMWTAQAAGRIFRDQGFGNLIVTASVSSVFCNVPQTQVAYNSSKAAAAHLTRCLAVEWAGFARVNCISPGFVNTLMVSSQGEELMNVWKDQIPCRRFAQPEELKGTYVFLASDACPYMTGAELFVDGGCSLI